MAAQESNQLEFRRDDVRESYEKLRLLYEKILELTNVSSHAAFTEPIVFRAIWCSKKPLEPQVAMIRDGAFNCYMPNGSGPQILNFDETFWLVPSMHLQFHLQHVLGVIVGAGLIDGTVHIEAISGSEGQRRAITAKPVSN